MTGKLLTRDLLEGIKSNENRSSDERNLAHIAIHYMDEAARYRKALGMLRDCEWIITPADRMDAVRDIARAALDGYKGKAYRVEYRDGTIEEGREGEGK